MSDAHHTQHLPSQPLPAQQQAGHEWGAPAPHDHPGPAAAAPGRRRMGTGAKVLAVVGVLVLVAVVALIGLEFGMRKSITDRIEQNAAASLGSPAHAELGASPVLLSALDDTLDEVHITTDGSAESPAVDVTGEGVHTEGDKVHMDSLSGNVFVSEQAMAAAAKKSASGATGGTGSSESPLGGLTEVQSVKADPASGTLKVSIGGLAEATVQPTVAGGKLQLTPQKASFFGVELPSSLLGGASQMMSDTVGELPEGVEVKDVHVVDGGMKLDLGGANVVFDQHR